MILTAITDHELIRRMMFLTIAGKDRHQTATQDRKGRAGQVQQRAVHTGGGCAARPVRQRLRVIASWMQSRPFDGTLVTAHPSELDALACVSEELTRVVERINFVHGRGCLPHGAPVFDNQERKSP
jgi:hypothetical protein